MAEQDLAARIPSSALGPSLPLVPDGHKFRLEFRDWLAENTPRSLSAMTEAEDFAFRVKWQKALHEGGWAGPAWPVRYGGRGSGALEQFMYYEELALAQAPRVTNESGILLLGPTLMVYGTEEQKRRYLPGILSGDDIWCQGFSEPNAGSDLASLRTRAARDGDDYVLNGQKIWTSFGHMADYCEMLVRTDPEAPKHKGISWLIVPMDTPGIDVRRLETMEGTAEFCEVFYDDVHVPVANRVGDENDGWRVAMVTLSFERGTALVSDLLVSMELVRDLADLAKSITSHGATRWEDAGLRREIGRIAAEFDALWALTKRNISQAQRTGLVGVGGNVFKLAWTDLRQHMGDVAMRLLDRASLSLDDVADLPTGEHVHGRFYALSMTIAAGTSQVNRNIVGERVLGLPKDR